MKIIATLSLLTGLASIQPAAATEYIHRELLANTLPGAQCETAAAAKASALKPYTLERFSKKFCQSQGYGWHLEKVENSGNSVCTPCADKNGLQKCFQQDVVVSCKRIKPGTVGMLPGKG